MFSRFLKKAKKPSQSAQQSTKSGAAQGFPRLTTGKIKEVIISLNEAESIFERAGYHLQQMKVEFGNTPKLIPHFKQLNQIDEDEQDALLAEVEDKPLIRFVLISLFKSSQMQSLFDNSALYFYGMEIDISGSPCVRTIFKRKQTTTKVFPLKAN